MNTTERFRANCRRLPEASYARLFAALAKQEKRMAKWPKMAKQGPMPASNGQPTVRQMIAGALESGQKTRAEIAKMIGKSNSHVSAELSDLRRMGVVEREVRKIDGFNTPVWSLP